MTNVFRCAALFFLAVALSPLAAADTTFSPPSATQLDPKIEARVDGLLKQLTLEEKVGVLSGSDYMHTMGVPRLGIPALQFSDGPVGVRCWGQSTAYPAGPMLASTWDPAIAQSEGAALGRDARARGVHVVLGPGVNIYREAQNGRNFEYFGEDPFLASAMVVGYIRGVQSQGVAACVKHFVANGEETERGSIDTIVSKRALEEIYFPPFKAAVEQANAWTMMAAYNKVNGDWCTANHYLLTDVLRDEWGFKGILMSDWGAAHDTEKDLNAGLDLEMNGAVRQFYNMNAIAPLLKSGAVTQATLDEHVRRILRTMIAMGFMDHDQTDTSIQRQNPQNEDVAFKVASEGIVLLKNEKNVLPLDRTKVKHIIVTGPNGEVPVIGGGGSSGTDPYTQVSVLQAVQQIAGSTVQVEYIADLANLIFSQSVYGSSAGTTGGNDGPLSVEFFTNKDLQGEPLIRRKDRTIDFTWGNDSPVTGIEGQSAFSARWRGTITPAESGDYVFAIASDDGSRAFLDDKPILDIWSNHALMRKETTVHLEKNQTYKLRVEYFNAFEGAEMHFGWAKPGLPPSETKWITNADAVVYAGGLNAEIEHEGNDRPWEMPASQVAQLAELLKLNSHVIVAVNAGGNLGLGDNLDKIPALLWAWYPGQNGNLALAKIIFGDLNPSGHLPDTFEKRFEDAPAFANYPGDFVNGGTVHLDEGIYIGYRWFDKKKIEPAFPFGFGLSYTHFKIAKPEVSRSEQGGALHFGVSVEVTNSGKRDGAEVVQLYLRPKNSTVDRPPQELKTFARVELKAGETKRVDLPLKREDFAIYDEGKSAWTVPAGTYDLAIGTSSREIVQTGSITIKGD